jgi:Spy/CpxP family protein refolding chaperone
MTSVSRLEIAETPPALSQVARGIQFPLAAQSELRDLFQAGAGDREEMRKKAEALRAKVNEKATAVLTPEQQTKWKEMTGAPFKGEIHRQRRGGGQAGA